MNDRPNDLLRIRPEIKKTKTFDTMSAEERFQNETLRPILKLQNPLFVKVFQQYIEKRKGVFYDLGLEKKLAYIESSLIKDQKFYRIIREIFLVFEDYIFFLSSIVSKKVISGTFSPSFLPNPFVSLCITSFYI